MAIIIYYIFNNKQTNKLLLRMKLHSTQFKGPWVSFQPSDKTAKGSVVTCWVNLYVNDDIANAVYNNFKDSFNPPYEITYNKRLDKKQANMLYKCN